MQLTILISLLLLNTFSCGKEKQNSTTISKITTDTCENPDADISCCFVNIPEKLSSVILITKEDELGKKMIINGKILKADGKTPYPGVIIYAYHTDNNGYYSKKGDETGIQKFHGHLHGWGKTDDEGRYEIHSIKPAEYPSNNAPAHIHCVIKFPDGRMTYINDFVFAGDPLVNENYLSRLRGPGDNGVIELKENNGILTGERTTVIGIE